MSTNRYRYRSSETKKGILYTPVVHTTCNLSVVDASAHLNHVDDVSVAAGALEFRSSRNASVSTHDANTCVNMENSFLE